MKRTIQKVSFFVLATILFTSCNSSANQKDSDQNVNNRAERISAKMATDLKLNADQTKSVNEAYAVFFEAVDEMHKNDERPTREQMSSLVETRDNSIKATLSADVYAQYLAEVAQQRRHQHKGDGDGSGNMQNQGNRGGKQLKDGSGEGNHVGDCDGSHQGNRDGKQLKDGSGEGNHAGDCDGSHQGNRDGKQLKDGSGEGRHAGNCDGNFADGERPHKNHKPLNRADATNNVISTINAQSPLTAEQKEAITAAFNTFFDATTTSRNTACVARDAEIEKALTAEQFAVYEKMATRFNQHRNGERGNGNGNRSKNK